MKKILFLFTVVLLLVSCHKPENKPVIQPWVPERLIGKWKPISIYNQLTGAGPAVWHPYQTANEYDFWFKETGEYSTFEVNPTCPGIKITYVVSKNLLITFTSTCGTGVGTGVASIDSLYGDTLIINSHAMEIEMTKSVRVKN